MRLRVMYGDKFLYNYKLHICLKCGIRTWWNNDTCLKHSNDSEEMKDFYYESMKGLESGRYYLCA